MREWTAERLEALSQKDRHNLWVNAKAQGATEVVQAIETCGLPYANPKGVSFDDEVGRAIKRLVNSKEGKEAALAAAASDRPALEAIDLLLQRELGDTYRTAHEATVQAGYAVALLMRRLGFHDAGTRSLGAECIAARGILFVKRPLS
jgi:hypothetical protein